LQLDYLPLFHFADTLKNLQVIVLNKKLITKLRQTIPAKEFNWLINHKKPD